MTFIRVRLDADTKEQLAKLPLNTWKRTFSAVPMVPAFAYYAPDHDAYFLAGGSDRAMGERPVYEYYSLTYGSNVVAITGMLNYAKHIDGRHLSVWEIEEIVVPAALGGDAHVWELLFAALTEFVRKVPNEEPSLVAFRGNLGLLPVSPGKVY